MLRAGVSHLLLHSPVLSKWTDATRSMACELRQIFRESGETFRHCRTGQNQKGDREANSIVLTDSVGLRCRFPGSGVNDNTGIPNPSTTSDVHNLPILRLG